MRAVQEPLLHAASDAEHLLQPAAAWLLGLSIGPAVEAREWRCIYSSATHGLSMNRFVHHVANYGGPTLLLASTDEGEVFGAYVDTPLKPSDSFFGGRDCFLFHLAPTFHVFRTTNVSSNFCLFSPHTTGQLRGGHYMSEGADLLGFGGQKQRLRLGFEEDLNLLRWHNSCTSFEAHPNPEGRLKEGVRKVELLELYGCGGAEADMVQRELRERRAKDAAKAGKVDRAAMFGLGKGVLGDEGAQDKFILETAGVHTFYSSQLEPLPQEPPSTE